MSIQFPQVDIAEGRLLPDNSNLKNTEQSFDEKLRSEQARLGLLFSPLSQFNSFFSDFNGSFAAASAETLSDMVRSSEIAGTADQNIEKYHSGPDNVVDAKTGGQPQIFEALPTQNFNRMVLQELLSKNNWLIPNLEASPLPYQAFLQGTLRPSFDLQSLIDEIVKQVSLVKEKGKTELHLTLKPAELGEITLTLTLVSGAVLVAIQASPETKKLIDSRRAELEQALKKLNINLAELKIEEVRAHV